MSQENAQVAWEGNEAFRRGDWEALAERLDLHILLRAAASWPEQRIYGREAVFAFYRGIWDAGGPDLSIDDMMDLGDRVVVRMRWHVRGLRSGVEGEQRLSAIFTIRERRIILAEYFIEHEQALKAIGLEE